MGPSRVQIIERGPCRLHNQMRHVGDRERVVVYATRRIENEKIAWGRPFGGVRCILERFHRKPRRDAVCGSRLLPMDKRLLPRIKIGEHNRESGMGTHRRERPRQGRLADASLLTDEGDYRGHGCVPTPKSLLCGDRLANLTALLIEPSHDFMQPPSHPAFADFDALWKLALLRIMI